jgi:hypothetical protein
MSEIESGRRASVESFIVRVWVPGEGDGQAGERLRGQLVRLATGTTHTFRDPSELLALLRAEFDGPLRLPDVGGALPLDDAPA